MAERWRTLLGRVPEIEPDVERLRSRALDGPRLPDPPSTDPRRRIAVAAFAMAIGIAAFALVFVALREDRNVLPAGERAPRDTLVESGGTYLLSDFRLDFPAEIDSSSGDEGLYARIRFHSEWSSTTWPGEAECEFRVVDRAGGVVASQPTGFSVAGPTSDTTQVTLEVPPDAKTPVAAEGECGPGMVFDGSSHYVFSDLRIEGGDLVGDVAWSAGTPVGYAACGIHAVGADGTEAFQVLGLGAGPGNDRTIALLGGKFPAGATPEIRCEPYQLPEQFTRAYWMPWQSGPGERSGSDDAPAAPADAASTYVFSDIVAGPSSAEPEDLSVTFEVSWSGEDYPGVHLCTFRALAADGSIAGEVAHLAAWQPGRWYRDVPGDPDAAVRGDISCAPERLDAPGIAEVTPIPRSEGTTLDEVMAERAARLDAWAARWSVDSMSTSQLAANMWAVWEVMTEGEDEDLTVTWQLTDRRHYLCVRLPPEHEFRGGEFCD
jgi:hypothetical protein